MEQSRKHLKISSIVVLIFAAMSLLNILSEWFFGELNNAQIPAGSPDNILLITKTILLVLSLLFLLPQVYIGLKGLKMAKCPDSSKAHIVWGIILLVFAVVELITPLTAIVKRESVTENVLMLCSILVDVIVFFDYIKAAKDVLKDDQSNM